MAAVGNHATFLASTICRMCLSRYATRRNLRFVQAFFKLSMHCRRSPELHTVFTITSQFRQCSFSVLAVR